MLSLFSSPLFRSLTLPYILPHPCVFSSYFGFFLNILLCPLNPTEVLGTSLHLPFEKIVAFNERKKGKQESRY